MADTYALKGSWSVTPPSGGSASGFPSIDTPLDEVVQLGQKHLFEEDITVDSPLVVNFGGVTNAHVVFIKTVGGKVEARLTSADGATQSIPINSILQLISTTVPVTAIDLTRVTGQATKVQVFLGEKA